MIRKTSAKGPVGFPMPYNCRIPKKKRILKKKTNLKKAGDFQTVNQHFD